MSFALTPTAHTRHTRHCSTVQSSAGLNCGMPGTSPISVTPHAALHATSSKHTAQWLSHALYCHQTNTMTKTVGGHTCETVTHRGHSMSMSINCSVRHTPVETPTLTPKLHHRCTGRLHAVQKDLLPQGLHRVQHSSPAKLHPAAGPSQRPSVP